MVHFSFLLSSASSPCVVEMKGEVGLEKKGKSLYLAIAVGVLSWLLMAPMWRHQRAGSGRAAGGYFGGYVPPSQAQSPDVGCLLTAPLSNYSLWHTHSNQTS